MKAKHSWMPAEDKVFGNDSCQHSYGTKLLAHFDDDPNKPMNSIVVGSRWKKDDLDLPGMQSYYIDGREPMYVIWMNGELSQIGLMDAHVTEGYTGWKVVGKDTNVNARLDALARAHQNNSKNDEDSHAGEEDDDDSIDSNVKKNDETATLNKNIRRTLAVIHDEEQFDPWDKSAHGIFLDQFLMHLFTQAERDRILTDGSSESDNIAEEIIAYPMEESCLHSHERSFYTRLAIAKMVVYYAKEKYGAIIVQNARRTKFQAIEFNNWYMSQHLVPCISITYATDPEGIDNPTLYLSGEKIKILDLSNELAVLLENHLLNCVTNKGLNDIGSGLLYHEGYLVPMEMFEWKSDTLTQIVPTTATIPNVNFGVEIELSCASGNYQQRVATSIAKHAHVDVRIGRPSGKGGKGGYRKGGGGFTSQLKSSSEENHGTGKREPKWKLVYDKSIQPNPDNPQSLMFELVSPILSGSSGLDTLSNTVIIMRDVACVRVNESMGLHVHVEAKEEQYSLDNMKSICSQFLVYESAIDSFLPYHRRTGSDKCHSYFESNALSLMSLHDTLEGSLKAIVSCQTRSELYELMNLGVRGRYHKLNLQNLLTGRQPTIEFRQHHATKDELEIVSWVRFCVLFVVNASNLPPVGDNIMTDDDESTMFSSLFQNIIKCPILHDYYSKKRAEYKTGE